MKKIKTALLSFGMSGRVFHAPFIHMHPGFELAGAWERNKLLIKQKYLDTVSYPTLEAVLEDDSIDLVVVNTPTYTHYEYAKKALQAGKHVIVEKAFTTTLAEAVELKKNAENGQRKLAVFQNRRWDSDFKTVKDVLDKQLLGDIVEAEIHYDRFNPNLSPKQHKERKNAGAGLLKDLGPHLADQAVFLFGMPEAIFADLRITRETSEVDDYFDLLLFYPSFRVRLKAGYFIREAIPSFIVHGKKGSFLKARGDTQESTLLKDTPPDVPGFGAELPTDAGVLHTERDGAVVKETIPSLTGNYYDYYDLIYKSLTENIPEPVTADDGIRVMLIIEAALQSNEEKRVISLQGSLPQ